jgi:hypothetical protein
MPLPLLWSLVEDNLLLEPNDGHYTVGYADDTVILINGKFPQPVPEALQASLYTVQQSCDTTNLSTNGSNTFH